MKFRLSGEPGHPVHFVIGRTVHLAHVRWRHQTRPVAAHANATATACRPGASRSMPADRHSACPQRGQVEALSDPRRPLRAHQRQGIAELGRSWAKRRRDGFQHPLGRFCRQLRTEFGGNLTGRPADPGLCAMAVSVLHDLASGARKPQTVSGGAFTSRQRENVSVRGESRVAPDRFNVKMPLAAVARVYRASRKQCPR